jgi:hypothetical protein
MLLQLVPPRVVPARLFITSDGMHEERMQDLETPSLAQNHTLRHGPAHAEGSKKDDQP